MMTKSDWQTDSMLLTARIGRRMHALRTEQGLSLADIGQDDLSRTHLSNIERGRIRPSLQALLIIARRLGVPIETLVREDDPD